MPLRAAITTILTLALAFCASIALAGGKSSVDSSRAAADCNAQAAGMTGAQRDAFMQSCMKSGSAAPSAPQDPRAACRDQANSQGLRGDERRNFMSRCVSQGGG